MRKSAGLLFVLAIAGTLAGGLSYSVQTVANEAEAQSRSRATRRKPAQIPRVDYTSFSHQTEKHRLECNTCHKFPSKNWKEARKGDDAFADVTEFPEHDACLNCHRTQFFARERPAPRICSNCHVAITPRDTARYPFPSLGEPFFKTERGEQFVSEFQVMFPHDKHVDVVGSLRFRRRNNSAVAFVPASFRADEPKSCPVCHETYQPQGKSSEEYVTKPPSNLAEDAFWLKKGTFKTIPISHSACSTCHNEEAGIPPAPGDCAACHKLKPANHSPRDFDPQQAAAMGITDWRTLRLWSKRSTSRYRHEFDAHVDLSCNDCHNPAVMNTLEEKTLVNVKSCGGSGSGCHIETSTDGILNYEIDKRKTEPGFQCTKCHVNLGKKPVPADHLEAIKAVTK